MALRTVDIVIAVVIVACVGLSAFGLSTYQRGLPPEAGVVYDVSWRMEEKKTIEVAEKETQGASRSVELVSAPLPTNLTKVSVDVVVKVQGQRTSAVKAVVTVEAAGVNKTVKELDFATGDTEERAKFEFDLAKLPTVKQIPAESQEAALANLTQNHGSSEGKGPWKITVTFSGGNPDALIGAVQRTEAASAKIEYERFHALVQLPAPEGGR